MAHPRPTIAGIVQPNAYIGPRLLTSMMRRIASSTELFAALNSPADNASTTVNATVVQAMAANANRTPATVPVTACARARSSRRQAARISCRQNVQTVSTRPIGSSSS